MADTREYKCPCCGGAIAFDSTIQKLKCPYCDTEFNTEDLKKYDEDLNNDGTDDLSWDKEPGIEWDDGETDGMRVYHCNSCGGDIIGDENTAATTCPYCGNNVVMSGNLSGALKPDYIIPFKLDKNDAKNALRKHLKGKLLLPKAFADENHIDEIKGVYVPFWLFDTDADANIRYRGTKVRFWSDSEYNYTQTSHFSVRRAGSMGFERIPVDGSTQMPDDLMESIEPFDKSQAVDFQTAYMAGYLADKYDVNAEESISRANERVKKSAEETLASTVHGYETLVPESTGVKLKNGMVHYAMYPVWLLSTTWNDQNYLFAMNGQTGKFVGDLPVDKAAALRWTVIFFIICSAAVFGVELLLHMIGLI